jgi:hypothetical protein
MSDVHGQHSTPKKKHPYELKALEIAYMKSNKPVPLRRPFPVKSSKSINKRKPIIAAFPLISSFLLVKPKPPTSSSITILTSSILTSDAVNPGCAFPLNIISADPPEVTAPLILMYIFSPSIFTGYTNSFLNAGVRALKTGLLGYHSFISPVRRSNVLSVVGQTMQPS